jgi:hypothetical protein
MNTLKNTVLLVSAVMAQMPENSWLIGFMAETVNDRLNDTEFQCGSCFKFDTGSLFIDVMSANDMLLAGNFSDVVEGIMGVGAIIKNLDSYFDNSTAGCRVPVSFFVEPIQDWAYPIIG